MSMACPGKYLHMNEDHLQILPKLNDISEHQQKFPKNILTFINSSVLNLNLLNDASHYLSDYILCSTSTFYFLVFGDADV